MRSTSSAIPDKVVNYDLVNDARLEDDNKKWVDECEFLDNYYAIGGFDFQVLHDETGKVDIADPIDRSYTTTTLSFGAPSSQKIF